MDIIKGMSIKVPNSILVHGLTGKDVDEELFEFLKKYGSISRVLPIDSSDPDFKNTTIVEFQFGTAIEALQGDLPCQRPSSDPSITHSIQVLTPLYSSKMTCELTHTYLTELKGVAKVSGSDYERLLLEELNRIQGSTKSEAVATPEESSSELNEVTPVSPDQSQPPQINQATPDPVHITLPAVAAAAEASTPLLSPKQITIPEVQRVIVEHIVKSNDMSQTYPSSSKFRPFSGKTPCPNMEVEYDSWRSNVEFYLADPSVSDRQVVRKIIDSLLPPAANIVKHLGPLSTPDNFLALLDSAYGTVDDVDELFAKFLSTNQNAGEKPSAYLHRLQTTLTKVVKGGGVPAADFDRQLLKQFCRGCWDNSLLISLQLEQKKSQPPTFSELLLQLRTEEDKQAAKSSRMKQHLGLSKLKVQSNPLSVYSDIDMTANTDDKTHTLTQKLQQQIAQLQNQLTSLKASIDEPTTKKSQTKAAQPKKGKLKEAKPERHTTGDESGSKSSRRPRPWYCFTCGEDGHIATTCTEEPNPDLVESKRKELKSKQRAWDEHNKTDLN